MPKIAKLTEWEFHCKTCDPCRTLVDLNYTASLINVCPYGAPALKDHLARIAAKERPRAERDKDKAPQYVVRERYTATEIDPKTEKPVKVEKEKTISPAYLRKETAREFLSLAMKTMGGKPSRFFISQR